MLKVWLGRGRRPVWWTYIKSSLRPSTSVPCSFRLPLGSHSSQRRHTEANRMVVACCAAVSSRVVQNDL